nr:MAG TPA: minor capsid protein [Caudoviricetes sp.]
MDDEAMRIADEIEKALTQRISAVYGEALKKAIRMNRQFLQKIRDIDSGKIQPPNYYNTPELIKKWREGYIRELMRQEHVIESIEQQIRDAGGKVEPEIKKALVEIYAINANYTATKLTAFGGVDATSKYLLTGVTRRQAAIIFRDTQPLFSKIAFRNLIEAPAVIRRLQNEMVQATLLGESQEKIIRRIRAVMDNSAANARRIAQTERTRLQSQARADQLHEAAQMGIRITKTWSTRMVNSRDSHVALNNKTIAENEKFRTIWGNELAYPGDPSAPAKEVINCHCVLIPNVVTDRR